MVECFHKQLKAALKVQPQPSAWIDALPLVLLGLRSALKEDIAATAAEMVYGTTLRLPGGLVNPTIHFSSRSSGIRRQSERVHAELTSIAASTYTADQ